jgi:hypothetical protein
MLEWADEELAALIRRVLPPRRPEWRVQVVDNPDEACAMFTQDILRVQRHWREAVYEAGLHLVVGHYPLSLERMRPLSRAATRVAVEVWKARAIRRHGKANFTGVMGYVARLVEGKELAFVESRKEATRLALQGISGPGTARGQSTRARARRDAESQARLRERRRQAKYDGDFRVDAATYELLLPRHLLDAYSHYETGIPLLVIENAAVDLVPSLDELRLHDLEFQMDCDRRRAEAEWAKANSGLAPEDAAALSELGGPNARPPGSSEGRP